MRTISGLALALVFVASTARAEPPVAVDAPAHFQRALELYQEQDFAGALVEFRRAQELAPSYKMYFNIGQVCYQLTDYACAMRSFETYLKEGGGAISTERKSEVEHELTKLRLRVGHLEIVTNIPGVEIAIDDVSVGKTPLPQSVVVSTGKRRITGTHDGFAPVSRIVEVAGTDSSRVELSFASGTSAVPETKYESRWNTISWLGLGSAVVFGAASGITGGMALSADNELAKQTFAAGRGPTAEMKSNQDRARTLSVVSDVALGLSIATLAGTLVYTFVHKPKAIEEQPAPEPPKVDVSFTGTGAMLRGSF